MLISTIKCWYQQFELLISLIQIADYQHFELVISLIQISTTVIIVDITIRIVDSNWIADINNSN